MKRDLKKKRLKWIKKILIYLNQNQNAKDTPLGIAAYWLLEKNPETCEEEVEILLKDLVAFDWLNEREITQTQRIYGLNKDSLEKIKHYLRNTAN